MKPRCDGSLQSARVIVPIILNYFPVRSVVDSGIGTWLKVFEENVVPDILGIDGPHVDQNMLVIEQEKFLAADLRNHRWRFLSSAGEDTAIIPIGRASRTTAERCVAENYLR
jgi:hypothetical protein